MATVQVPDKGGGREGGGGIERRGKKGSYL